MYITKSVSFSDYSKPVVTTLYPSELQSEKTEREIHISSKNLRNELPSLFFIYGIFSKTPRQIYVVELTLPWSWENASTADLWRNSCKQEQSGSKFTNHSRSSGYIRWHNQSTPSTGLRPAVRGAHLRVRTRLENSWKPLNFSNPISFKALKVLEFCKHKFKSLNSHGLLNLRVWD